MTGRISRYFPDIWIKYRNSTGTITETVWEVKPKKYTEPPRIPKRKTKSWAYTAEQYVINQAKWKAAEVYCKKRGQSFQIITEDHLKTLVDYSINSIGMSDSLQRLKSRVKGAIFGASNKQTSGTGPDLSRGSVTPAIYGTFGLIKE